MPAKSPNRDKLLALWPGLVQIGLTLLITVVAYFAVNGLGAKSAFLGGLVVIIPYAYFAARMKPVLGKSDSRSFLRAIAVAEVGKLILTMACCAVVFVWVKPLDGLSFFISMAIVYFISHMSLILAIKNTT